jgi:hypothetical protein
MMNHSIKIVLIVMLAFTDIQQSWANDGSMQDWQWHGFAAQGLIAVDGSDFVSDDNSVSTQLTELGLNTSTQISANLRFAAQAVYLDGGNRYFKGARIDYLLLDWNFLNTEKFQGNFYLGRFKNVHWLYSSTRDVPFARPSIILPQSVYFDGFRDIAVGGDGSALKLSYSDDNLGDVDVNFSYGTSPLSKEQSQLILSQFSQGRIKQDFDAQASFYWRPALSQWRFGLSLLNSDFSYKGAQQDLFSSGKFAFQFYTLNALYEGEQWEFSGEIYQERFVTTGFYHPAFLQENIGQGMYGQARYQLNNDLTLLARYEKFYANKEDKKGKKLAASSGGLIPSYFAFQNDLVIGLSYDFNSNLKLRLEQHWMDGGARLTPVVLPNPQVNDQQHWQITALQLMYWF